MRKSQNFKKIPELLHSDDFDRSTPAMITLSKTCVIYNKQQEQK